MKKIVYTFIFALSTMIAIAQTAPDFTVTDTHGETHALYADYLNQNTVVVLDLFFVDCPPCNDFAPYLEAYWKEQQAAGAPVQFLSLTSQPGDNDAKVLGFEEAHGLTFPAASADGGAVEAQAPFVTGDFGPFFGYPTLVVISPDGSVAFDPWGNSGDETIELLDAMVQEAISGIVSSTFDLENEVAIDAFPNPTTDYINIDLTAFGQETTIEVFDAAGRLVHTSTTSNRVEKIATQTWEAGQYFLLAQDAKAQARQQFSVIR